jgi:hypothetical protein
MKKLGVFGVLRRRGDMGADTGVPTFAPVTVHAEDLEATGEAVSNDSAV